MTYKIDCAATGYKVSARPDVWEKRFEKMGTTAEGAKYNYISKKGLKEIKEVMTSNNLSAEKALAYVQNFHGLLEDPISIHIWPYYLSILEGEAIVEDFAITDKPTPTENHIKEQIETIEV